MTDNERVGKTLRTMRERFGYKSPEHFGLDLGISRTYIWQIESGRKALPDHLLFKAAALLECDPLAIKRPNQEMLVAA